MTTIKLAIQTSRTPEIPFFRYRSDGFKVFLWDNLTVGTDFDDVFEGIEPEGNYRILSTTAITKWKYLPWYNLADNAWEYQAYCLEDTGDLEYLALDDHETNDLMPLKGMLLNVSLPVLQLLDTYYSNTTTTERNKIEVFPRSGVTKPEAAYTWMNPLETIANYSSTTKDYHLREGTSIVPFAPVKGQELYSYTGG